MKKSDLKKFANLLVKMGVNVQPRQDVIIMSALRDSDFAHMVAKEAYKAKANKVIIEWIDDEMTLMNYKYQNIETLKEFPKWKEEQWKYKAEKLPCMIHIDSDDPDVFKDIDQDKKMQVIKEVNPKIWKYRKPMEGHYQWSIAAIPSAKWAKKLFPEDKISVAKEKLWQAIMTTSRLNGDPIKNWKEHGALLAEKCQKLNALNIKTLTYNNSLGTHFSVGLIPGTIFCAGSSTTAEGVTYLPNIPTEECFISPNKTTANGVVMASKPLSLMGKVVDHFGFEFKEGKVIRVIAQNDEERKVLTDLINTDNGASYLGEVALVPFDSPVNQTGLLFYNTLFDENACCHLAVGMGFEETIPDVEKKTPEEIAAYGINDSVIHVDFMIGTSDLSITALTRDGKTVPIFKDGTWAI